MILPDVNVLVYAHREEATDHLKFKSWLERALDGAEPVGMSDLVLSSCLRILTHPKVFSPPTPWPAAQEYLIQIRSHPNIRLIQPGSAHWTIFLDFCRQVQARGNLVTDAYLAALAMESGCEWITTDGDFARFPGLRWRHPLQA